MQTPIHASGYSANNRNYGTGISIFNAEYYIIYIYISDASGLEHSEKLSPYVSIFDDSTGSNLIMLDFAANDPRNSMKRSAIVVTFVKQHTGLSDNDCVTSFRHDSVT